MAELTDDTVSSTLDYLGQRQPFASPRLASLPSESAGGGTVAPPVTGGGGSGGVGGRLTGGTPTPMGLSPGVPGASPLAIGRASLELAQRAAGGARTLFDVFGQPTRGTIGGEGTLQTGAQSLSDEVRSLQAAGEAGAAAGGAGAGGLSAAESGATFGEGVASATPAAAGTEAASLLGAGASVLTAAGALYNAIRSPEDYQKAIHSLDAGLAVAGLFTGGTTTVIAGVIEALDALLGMTGVLGHQGPYGPKREKARGEAGAELGGMSQALQSAGNKFATSGNPADALAGLQTQFGERNPVRSYLKIPSEAWAKLGLGQEDAVRQQGYGALQWSTMDAPTFTKILAAFKANPAAINEWVQGSGDVAYLPLGQAQQVAAEAAQEGRTYLSFLVSQGGTPGAGPAATPPATAPAAPMAPPPTGPGGPEGALGFAQSVVP